MTRNIFHNKLVELIVANPQFMKSLVQFRPHTILTYYHFGRKRDKNYELDIYLESNRGESAIFEIKSHNGLRSTFTHHQLQRFREYHPTSQIWLIYPNIPYNLDITNLHCEFFEKLGTGEIEYI